MVLYYGMEIVEKNKKLNIKQVATIEILAQNPSISNKELAIQVGVGVHTIRDWKKNPIIIEAFYDRFMEVAGRYLPNVLMAQIREAELGNTQAATLVLKHWGKFQDVIVHKIEAPFAQFQKMQKLENIKDAEIVNDINVNDNLDPGLIESFKELPKRNEENNSPKKVVEKNNKRLKGAYKKDKINSQQMERHYWRKRAKAVGIEPLPPGRPSKDKLNRWQKDIIEAETKFANGILPNKQKSPN
tara:strand:- start:759 stop:1487 length:729 start_codon:yes stop_codon:yes gene_type:complete